MVDWEQLELPFEEDDDYCELCGGRCINFEDEELEDCE